ncbi:TrmH family RNA methyltransferase [Calditrichota bacterium]
MNRDNTDIPVARELPKADKKLLTWANRKGLREGERGILLEGDKLLHEGIAEGLRLILVWSTVEFSEQNKTLMSSLQAANIDVRLVTHKLMRKISELDTAPGVVAAAVEPGYIHLKPGDPFSLIAVLSKAQNPGNVGAVIRVCEYFGVDELWLGSESADPFSSRALRGAMGATFRTTVIRTPDLIKRVKEFKEAGASIWATTPHDRRAESSIAGRGSRILLIGGEAQGLDKAYFGLADHKVRIQGTGRGESLNLAVAAGILIHSATAGHLNRLDKLNAK